MPPTLIGTAATFLALHCIRGHLALWSDICTKISKSITNFDAHTIPIQ